MFDAYLRPPLDILLHKVARPLVALGVTANMITISGGVVGVCACVATALGFYHSAIVLLVLNRLCDGLDGAVARLSLSSDFGGFLDIVFDFLFYSLLPFSFALSRPEDSLAAAFLIVSFVGTGTSFLAYAIVAAKRGISTEVRGRKSFFYLGGLVEGAETIAVLGLILLFPEWFGVIAVIFGMLCWLTTIYRIKSSWQVFGKGY